MPNFRSKQSGGACRLLSRHEAIMCLELIHRCLECQSGKDLSSLLAELGQLIGAEHCAGLLTSMDSSRKSGSILFLDSTAPRGWLELYDERKFHEIDPIVAENFTNFSTQYWEDTYQRHPPPKQFLWLAEDFGLRTGYSGGFQDGAKGGGSLFSFAGRKLEKHPRVVAILDQVLPHLHRALCQLGRGGAGLVPHSPLSARAVEVLKWTGAGKSSWEIALILGVAERTVNFHVNNALRKLNVVNRTQAVAVALQLGLIELP